VVVPLRFTNLADILGEIQVRLTSDEWPEWEDSGTLTTPLRRADPAWFTSPAFDRPLVLGPRSTVENRMELRVPREAPDGPYSFQVYLMNEGKLVSARAGLLSVNRDRSSAVRRTSVEDTAARMDRQSLRRLGRLLGLGILLTLAVSVAILVLVWRGRAPEDAG